MFYCVTVTLFRLRKQFPKAIEKSHEFAIIRAMLSLSSRQSFILNRVVDTFIETGHPVSSQAVAYASPSPVSSATIRNEMGTRRIRAILFRRIIPQAVFPPTAVTVIIWIMALSLVK